MYERHYGSKYAENKNASTVAIAKLIRNDIKRHIEAGCLPDGKYSVRSKYFSGGSSIDIDVSKVEHKIYTEEYLLWVRKNQMPPRGTKCYTDLAQNILDTLQAISNQYNYDGSEVMVDYFDVNYYFHATFDWRWLEEIHGVI